MLKIFILIKNDGVENVCNKLCFSSSVGKSDVFEKNLRYLVISKIGKDLGKVKKLDWDAVNVFFYILMLM